jgi:hypothetical protein
MKGDYFMKMVTRLISVCLLGLLLCIGAVFAAPARLGPRVCLPSIDKAISVASQPTDQAAVAADIAVLAVREDPVSATTRTVHDLLINDRSYSTCPIIEIEAHSKVKTKPKISAYNGLGHDHFARADV